MGTIRQPHRPPPGPSREYRKKHIVFEIDGKAIAVSTFQPTMPVGLFYVLSRKEPVTKTVSDIERETLLAFECVEDVAPSENGQMVKIHHLQKWMPNTELTMYKFCVEG